MNKNFYKIKVRVECEYFILSFNLNFKNCDIGKYTGLLEVKFLTPEQLEGEFKAWTKKVCI